MQVEPARLVELAASSERILAAMRQDWVDALPELSAACDRLGDAAGAAGLTASYLDSLTDAGDVVFALTDALDLGVSGLVDAAQDAVRADDAVASDLDRTVHLLGQDVPAIPPGQGGR
ncbi:hypothetical protein [Nocardioides xinjiangensis]|uniref:hypothetical protein n=1 Tax=Nocardioides xinjiangensis TaxID=2817376 RepID=UPI001B3145C6|nr:MULTISPECIES: hypothetical protein [unclassified Nocardioides]